MSVKRPLRARARVRPDGGRPGNRAHHHRAHHHRAHHRGQSLVEFAITLPLLLLIVAGAIDLGRAYLSTINIQNAAKEGAFFGARNPGCDTDAAPGCVDPRNVTARVELELDTVEADSVTIGCYAPGTVDFSGPGKALSSCLDGDLYRVTVNSTFTLATPIVSAIVGNSIPLSSSATSVVLTSFAMTNDPIDPGDPGGTAQPTVTPGQCTVPNFTNGTKLNQAQTVWEDVAGFATTVTTIGPGGQDISWQSLPAGFVGPCLTTTISVSNSPQATPTPPPTVAPTASPSSSPAVTPSPAPTPANCTVPQMVRSGQSALSVTQAQGAWTGAGFRPENFSATRPPNNDYSVAAQSIAAGTVEPCLTAAITVSR